ncbi:MAG: glycosyltransferase family 2 protein [Rhodobacteraceae bacterium]|nr:glycosyltransferase family 2 protein [Paracoccaceae bacterium]
MKISCVMTAFSEGALMRQSVASVLNQTHADLELVIVDDGANAETKAVLAELDDPRVKLVEQSNDGLSAARNRGLRHCSGDYVCFLDADDVRAPWAFAEAAQAIAEQGAELLLVRGVMAWPHGRLESFFDESSAEQAAAEAREAGGHLSLAAAKAWAASFEPQSANKFISRALIERASLSFPNDHFFEDILFHALVIAHARSVQLLNARSFTYFHRQLRPQLTGSSTEIRFDIIGTATVAFQLLAAHPEFENARFRGAVAIGALRLLSWCEDSISRRQQHAFRVLLRRALRKADPRFFVIAEETPDPRGERLKLQAYAQQYLTA